MTPDEWIKSLAVEARARFPSQGFVFLTVEVDDPQAIAAASTGLEDWQVLRVCEAYAGSTGAAVLEQENIDRRRN